MAKVNIFFLAIFLFLQRGEGKEEISKRILDTCAPLRRTQPMFFSGGVQCFSKVLRRNLSRINEETAMNTTEILTSRGYTVSEYETISEDGYISLTVRVSGGVDSPPRQGKEPVLMFHGIGTSSGSWIIQPGKRNLVAMLVDAGYDVWLINGRGSIPSRKHLFLDPDIDLDYWEYTIEEIGTKDLPPIIHLILTETMLPKLHYICYSMGCGAYLAALSEKDELNNFFRTSILLGPAGFVGHTYGIMRVIMTLISNPIMASSSFQLLRGRVSFNSKIISEAFGLPPEFLCNSALATCMLCDNLIFSFFGGDPSQMNFTNLPYALSHLHDVTPLRVLRHYAQIGRDCKHFRKYDFGKELNLIKYGRSIPPEFNLKKISVPAWIFYGESDNIVTPPDVLRTARAMSSKAVKLVKKVPWPRFNHNDFILAKDADILLYNSILQILANESIL